MKIKLLNKIAKCGLVRLPETFTVGEDITEENGILVRWFDADRLRDFVRITIGDLEQMVALVDETARLLDEL